MMHSQIEKEIKSVLKKAGISGDISLAPPPKSEMGDLAFPVFSFAKEQGENPVELAGEFIEKIDISSSDLFTDVKAFGPYVNFYINTSALAKLVITDIQKQGSKYGSNNIGKGKKMMIEYPSQNTHKEFHVGHLRNVAIGNTLVQLYRKSGYTVVPINYINDFGTNVVRCLWGILNLHDGNIEEKNTQQWLGKVYAEASQHIKDNEELKPELEALQQKLESRDPEIWDLYEKTRDASLAGFEILHKELKAEHVELFLENQVKDGGQKVVDKLLKDKVAQVGEGGAVIVDLNEYNLDIALLRKSSGAGLYMTSDLELARQKFKKHNVEESINLTGLEQDFYFKQLFKVLELSGFTHKMTHIGHGLVNLASGKMSSRTGQVILYEDLRNEIVEKLEKETAERHEDWSEEQINSTARTLALASLKLTMQKHEAKKNITFDFKEATSFDGYSAPYILYAVARINSLLKKAGKISKVDFDAIKEDEEKKVLKMLASFPTVVEKALQQYNPSVISKYCFDLAHAFNDFYHNHSVLQAESKDVVNARLALSSVVKEVLEEGLRLLTIETVEEM